MLSPRGRSHDPVTRRDWIVAVLVGCALTSVLTYPTVRYFGSVGRVDTGDGRFSIWNVAWVAHALVDDPRHLFDANIFTPHPATLTYSELNLVAGVLAAPVYAAGRNPLAALNAAILLSLLGAFLAMWCLVRRLTGSTDAGLVAATGYTFSAYTAAHTAEIQLLMIFGFPLTMAAFHALTDRPTIAAGAGLGAALAAIGLASGYYGVFAGGLVGLASLLWGRRSVRYWASLGSAVAVLALLILPVMVPYFRARMAAGPLRTTNVEELRTYAATWRDYVTSGTTVDAAVLGMVAKAKQLVLPHLSAGVPAEVLFPGVILGVLAVAALWSMRHASDGPLLRRYVIIGILTCWASFGPRAGLYSIMMHILPGISMLRAPARLGIVVIFVVAVLAGFGYRRLAHRRPWLAPIFIVALIAELWVPWPLQGMPAPARAYQMLATLPRGGVVEFPFHYMSSDFHEHTRAMLRSTANWQPLLNGYSDFAPPDFYELALPVTDFPDDKSFDILRAHGVRYVVIRMNEYGTSEIRQRLLARFPPYEKYLHRLTNDHDVWLYEIVGWPATASRP